MPTPLGQYNTSRVNNALLAAFIPLHSTGATSLVLHPSAVVHELHSGLFTVRKSGTHLLACHVISEAFLDCNPF
jgi:hypothetical protein